MNKNAITIGPVLLALAALVTTARFAESRVQTPNQIIGDARTPISALPFTINKSGSYVVTRNLIGSSGQDGITITASDVTLDLNGFRLKGVPGALTGIAIVGSPTGLRIHGGTVRDWAAGIVGAATNNAVLSGMNVMGNAGVGVKFADGFVITPDSDGGGSCIASNGGAGIELGAQGSCHDVHVMNNGATEVVAGNGLALYGCKLDAGGGVALTAADEFEIRDTIFLGAVTLGSGGHAQSSSFRLMGTENITLADNNRIVDCYFRKTNSADSTPVIALGAGNLFDRNSADPWALPELLRLNGPDNRISNNHIVASGGVAPTSVIEILSARNVVAHNTIHASLPVGSAVIEISSGAANSVDSNTIRGNGVASINGVRLLTNDNVVISNTFGMLAGAPIDDQASGNLKGPIIDDAAVSTATNPASQWRP